VEKEAQAAAQRERRDAMPKEKVWEERYAQQQAQEKRRADLTDEQRQVERDAAAKAQRARRGVTSLYNALQLPVGQREDRLLYDFHASGSGFATVNSSRLPTLEEGSALHTECVNVVREEIRLRGNVNIADRARMVSKYAERQREAARLRSCGTCGIRDPSMWYSDLKKLDEIPHDHWSRIDPRAFARLLAAPMLRLKLPNRRGGDGNHSPSGLTTSCVYIGTTYIRNQLHETALGDITDPYVTRMKDRIASEFAVDASQICMGFFDEEWVLIPRVELHTCFEWKGSPFHIVPEAVERDPAGAPGIHVCKHCQRGWCTPRGDPLCEPPSPDNTGLDGARLLGHDDLYWQVRVPRPVWLREMSQRCSSMTLSSVDSRRSQGAPGNTRFLANTIAGGDDFGRMYWSQSPTYLRACGRAESKWFNPGPNREQRCSQERASAQQIAKIRAHFGLDRGLGRRPPSTAIVPLDPAVQRTFKKITRLLGFADIHPPDADKGWQFDGVFMQAWQEEYERKMDVPEIARKVQYRMAMHAATVINASVLCYLTRRAYLGGYLLDYMREEEPPPVLAEDAQEAPPPAIDAQLVGRTV
jgi:hypothetical protein